MFALAMCLGLTTSCNNKGDANKPAAIADIVKDAKENGAKWSVDEWKASYREMMIAVKPVMTKMAEVIEQIQKDPSKADEMAKKMEEVQKEYPDFEKMMDEYEAAAKASENGKKVDSDEAFINSLKTELGIPDL